MPGIRDDWPRLAILYDASAKFSPSNSCAIDMFMESAINHRLYPGIISTRDLNLLGNFNHLLIRVTTHPNNPTFAFAQKARQLGMRVLDRPRDILVCNNKWLQALLFKRYKIPHPKTWLLNGSNFFATARTLPYPVVIKEIDSCFSQGVYLANDQSQLMRLVTQAELLKKHKRFIAQEFIKSSCDWRIGVLNNQVIYACKYYFAPGDWKIVKYDRHGDYVEGNHEAVAIEDVPPAVIRRALEACSVIGKGLYGVDIKATHEGLYVIEVNDNPTIDRLVEDEVEGEAVYDKIIEYFLG